MPVVMFTHTGSEEIAAAGLRAGLADYVIKTPTHYGRLAHAVRLAIRNATAARNEREAGAREREALRTAEEGAAREGRIPRHAVSRAADANERDPGVGAVMRSIPERIESRAGPPRSSATRRRSSD